MTDKKILSEKLLLITILLTFLITNFLWLFIGDYLIQEQYCKLQYNQFNKTDVSFNHFPSVIIDKSKEDNWKNESYKQKYLK